MRNNHGVLYDRLMRISKNETFYRRRSVTIGLTKVKGGKTNSKRRQ